MNARSRPPITTMKLSLALVAALTCACFCFAEPDDTLTVPNKIASRVGINQVALQLRPGAQIGTLERRYGLKYLSHMDFDPSFVLFETASVTVAEAMPTKIARDGTVVRAFPIARVNLQPMAFTPNDPYYLPVSTFNGQWHLLHNSITPMDVNVVPAWANDWTGKGVVLGIVDDSIQGTHPDLAPNFSVLNSWDFADKDSDPAPTLSSDRHGVATSGVAVGRGGNGIGVTGAAPFGTLAGLRIGFGGSVTDADVANAVGYRSTAPNLAIKIKNHSYGYTSPFVDDSLSVTAVNASGASGTIHCFSAGNARGTSAQDSTKQQILNSRYTITVAAIRATGTAASYSSYGANVFCTAPSNGTSNFGITTTDRLGTGFGYDGFVDNDYTASFGGTSSASPLVAGVAALVKQVNPNLDTRLLKHLMVRTCKVVDASTTLIDGGWRTNSAGFKFNQEYGFGRVDATALTNLAQSLTALTPADFQATGTVNVAATIPDNNTTTGITRTFTITKPGKVEDVEIDLNLTHGNRGHLQAFLTSPSGLVLRMFRNSSVDSNAMVPWKFLMNGFWGENAVGTWTITITDGAAGVVGTWNSFAARVNIGEPLPTRPISGNIQLQSFPAGPTMQPVTLDFYAPGGSTLLESQAGHLDSSGNFTVYASVVPGTYDVYARGAHWLQRRRANVVVSAGGATGLNYTLENGDINSDNEVSFFDYLRLSAAYESDGTNADFDSNCDLNGDGGADFFDYLILSQYYDAVGD